MIYQVWVDNDVAGEFLDRASAEQFAYDLLGMVIYTMVTITDFRS